ncbi:MAG: peptidase [Planctomycetaceae bacterium]|nr:peptidase [Planctomycetaceae bacterium]
MRSVALAATIVCLACSVSLAASPRFTSLQPLGGQRGTEVETTLYGNNLDDAEEVLIYDPGVEVTSFAHHEDEKQKARQLKVKFKIAEDCRLGTIRMRIRTKTGLSDLQNFLVSALPVVEEKEPNTDFEQPQVIEKNVTIQGRVDREDVDYYVIEAKQGERISAEIIGTRLGRSSSGNYFDPYLSILNEERFELAISDDAALLYTDAVVSVVAPADGKYIVQVRDASYNGDGNAVYMLSVGNFPRPRAVIPAGGKPGEKITVTMIGDVSGPITQEVTLPQEPDDRFGLEVRDEHGVSPSVQPFRVSRLDNFVEQEPNNNRNEATVAAAPGACNGVIAEDGDMDFYKFSAKKDQEFEIEVYARRLRTGLDPVVAVYRMDNGGGVGSNDDSRGPDSFMNFKAPVDGDYVVAVWDHLKTGDPTYAYRIEITPKEPVLYADPIEFARYQQHQIIIPQGAGSGIVANVRRENFGGPVNFRSDTLPEGVSIVCPEGWRGGGTMPVIFYAAENAPVGGKFSKVTTFLDDPNQKDRVIEGPLRQDILMVRGRNNDRVWEERMNRLPITVVEKAPFKVWIEAPQVPLVRGGSMNLTVKCERQEGWDEEIRILMLQNPPGVNASGSIKFAKGQTEVGLPINAAGNAAVQETMIALRCIATVGNGSYELCTEFVPLRVEEQYVTFQFAQAAVEKGQECPMVVMVTKRKDFEGEAEAKLVGLPANATAEPVKFGKDATELLFTVKTTGDTPPGQSKNVLCIVQVPEAGTTIQHTLGSGVLRVDNPPPAPKNPAPTPEPKKEVAKAEPAKRPLSRLEQLRLEQKQRAEAGGEE